MSTTARHRKARTDPYGSLWNPRFTPEPGFENRGGSLHSYEYVGKHHPANDTALHSSFMAGWWNRE